MSEDKNTMVQNYFLDREKTWNFFATADATSDFSGLLDTIRLEAVPEDSSGDQVQEIVEALIPGFAQSFVNQYAAFSRFGLIESENESITDILDRMWRGTESRQEEKRFNTDALAEILGHAIYHFVKPFAHCHNSNSLLSMLMGGNEGMELIAIGLGDSDIGVVM